MTRTFSQSETTPRAAGDAGAVAAGLADHRRRFAGDRGLIDRGDTLDHLAVGRDDVAGLDQDHVADLEAVARHQLEIVRAVAASALGRRFRLGGAQRVGARLAAAFRHRLGEIGEIDREPQPGRDLADDAEVGRSRRTDRAGTDSVDSAATTSVTNITGLRKSTRGSSLRDRGAERSARDRRIEEARSRFCRAWWSA